MGESTQQKIKFPCDACGREFTWKPEIAGKRAKCKCGAVIIVPKTRPTSDEPPPLSDEFDLAGEEDAVVPPPPPPPPIPAAMATSAKPAKLKLKLGGGGASSGDNDTWKWWYYVAAGLAMVPVAFLQYFRLLDYEKGESSTIGLKSFERFLYGIAGKWGVCGFIILIGAVCIAIGLHKFKKLRAAA